MPVSIGSCGNSAAQRDTLEFVCFMVPADSAYFGTEVCARSGVREGAPVKSKWREAGGAQQNTLEYVCSVVAAGAH